jgi:ABC-type multidrug transport system fused ATPase/permease subunit
VTEAIGEKYSNIMFSTASLISGIGIAFYRGANFAAVCLAFVPIIFLVMCVFTVQIKKAAIAKMGVMKKLGGVVEESLTAIRLIASFANEDKEEEKFRVLAQQVCQVAKKQ